MKRCHVCGAKAFCVTVPVRGRPWNKNYCRSCLKKSKVLG